MTQVAIFKLIQARRFAIQAALHPPTSDEMHIGGAMVGAHRSVLRRTAAEFGIGHEQGVVPLPVALQALPKRGDRLGKLPQQVGVHAGLILVRIKSIQRDLDSRHFRAA